MSKLLIDFWCSVFEASVEMFIFKDHLFKYLCVLAFILSNLN